MIIDTYSNSLNVTARNLAAQQAADQTQRDLDAAAQVADLEWLRGFGACQFAECRYADLPNEDQRQGWRAAERASGEALAETDYMTWNGVSYDERCIQ